MMAKTDMENFIQFAVKRLNNPAATPEDVVASLDVEKFPYDDVPGRHYTALVRFRHYARATRLSTVRRYMLKE